MSNFIYAQINTETKEVVAVSVLAGEVIADNMIYLENVDYDLLGKVYTEDGVFIDNPNPPEIEPPNTTSELEQRIADLEMAIAAILGGAV